MNPKLLPRASGVYVLKLAGVVVYVGQSRNVRQRIAAHRHYAVRFDDVEFIPCHVEQLRQLEKEKITELRPTLNLYLSPNTAPTCMISFRETLGVKDRLSAAESCTGVNRTELILECIRMAHGKNGASLIPNTPTPTP